MKKLIYILILLLPFVSIGQSVVNRAGPANTVNDYRGMWYYNAIIPRYSDTSIANLTPNIGIDSAGAVIFSHADNTFYVRAFNPKRWVGWMNQTILPDGVYSGGDVAYTGTGLQFIVSPAVFVLNNRVYNTPQTTLTLDPADPTFGRIDAIILSSSNGGEATFVTGTPSANPQEPSLDPQTQIRRAIVTVAAGATTPTDVTQYIVYDENLGTPSEYAVTSDGTIDANNTEFPYHLTKAIKITALSTSQSIRLIYNDTLHTGDYGNLVGFARLQTLLPEAISYNARLYFENFPVSQVVAIPLIKQTIAQYQIWVILSGSFGLANIDFDEIRITRAGAGTLPVTYFDYIQWQDNVVPPVIQSRFGLEDNFATSPRAFNFNNTDFRFNNINKFIASVSNASDSSFMITNSVGTPLLRVAGTNGLTTTYQLRVGTEGGYIFTVDPSKAYLHDGAYFQMNGSSYLESYIIPYRVRRSYPMSGTPVGILFQNDNLDVAPNDSTGYYFTRGDWTSEDNTTRTKWYIRADGAQYAASIPHTATTDTFMVYKNGFYQGMTLAEVQSLVGGGSVSSIATNNGTGITGGTITSSGTLAIDTATTISTKANVLAQIAANGTFYNTNVGSSYRWVIPNTNTIKTLRVLNGILADSATSNTLSVQVDSTVYATKAFVASVAGGGGFTGVTSVSGVNTNGFAFSIANATTTPAITLSTSITGMLKGNGTAISAATVGTDYSVGTSALATGILKSTTATGALSIAVAGDFPTLNQNTTGTASNVTGTVLVANGGTGRTTNTAYALMAAGTTATGAMQQVSGVGTSGQVLTSNGAAALPTWQNAATGVASITGTANQVIASASTGAVTLSLPQSIATTSVVQFGRATLGGTAATSPLTFTSNTDATGAAGRWYYNGTRLGFSPSTTIKRVALTNDAAPTNGQIPVGNGTDFTLAAISPSNNTMTITNGSGTITVGLNMTPQTLTDGATITFNGANGFNATVTLGGTGRTLARSNWVAGATYTLRIVQDGTGNRTITTWPTGIRWPGGTAPVLATSAGAINIVSFYFDGTLVYGAFQSGAYQ